MAKSSTVDLNLEGNELNETLRSVNAIKDEDYPFLGSAKR